MRIEHGVTSIGRSAFQGCANLWKASVPETVKFIGRDVFFGCPSLSDVTLSPGLETLDQGVFCDCKSLTSLNIPDSVTSIGYAVFQRSGLRSADLSRTGLTSMGNYAFESCANLGSVSLPDSLEAVSEYAFQGCSHLSRVDMGEGVQSIGYKAFLGSGLREAAIPASVKSIGNSAFEGCTSLRTLTLHEGLTSIGSSAFGGCTQLGEALLPAGLLTVGSGAFYGCTALKTASVPSSVTNIYDEAFRGCGSLASLTLGEGETPLALGNGVFRDCPLLTRAALPARLTAVTENLFRNCARLETVTIAAGGTAPNAVGSNAFLDCPALRAVDIPGTVTTIGSSAFQNCSALTELTLHEGLNRVYWSAFENCAALEAVELPDTVTVVDSYAFKGSGIRQLRLSARLSTLGNEAFRNCVRLTSAVIPGSLGDVPSAAFRGCSALTDVVLEKGVSTVGSCAFQDCGKLRRVTVSQYVRSIGSYAFQNCASLESVYLPEDLDTLGSGVFENCASLTSVYVPEYVQAVPVYAFKGCASLREAVVAGAGTVGDEAFRGCASLESVSLTKSVLSVGNSAFRDCSALRDVYYYGTAADWSAMSVGEWNNDYFVLESIRRYMTDPLPGPAEATGVKLDKNSLVLGVGETARLTAVVEPPNAADKYVEWQSHDPSVATVSFGQVTGVAVGEALITVRKGSFEDSCTVQVVEAPRSLRLDFNGKPFTQTVKVVRGSVLDLSGFTVTAVYANGAEEPVPDYAVSGYYPNEVGSQKVTLSWRGVSAVIPVEVTAPKVIGIRIAQYPDKRVYAYGYSLNTSGLVVEALYDSGDVTVLRAGSSGYGYEVSGYENRTPGTQTVTILYRPQSGNDSFSTYFTVEVMEPALPAGQTPPEPRAAVQNVTGGRRVSFLYPSGVTVRYTTDGTEPTEASTAYWDAFVVNKSCTVKAAAYLSGKRSGTVTVKVSVPKLAVTPSSPAGAVPAGSLIALIPSVPGADIYYTTDGTDPNPHEESQRYGGAVAVSGNVTVKAIAVKPGCLDSGVAEFRYTVTGTAGTVVSVGTAMGGAGDVVSLPVFVLPGSGGKVNGFQTTLSFEDSAFELDSVTPAAGLENLFSSKGRGTVTLRCEGADMPGGQMCTVNLRARSAAASRSYNVAVTAASVQVDGVSSTAAGGVQGSVVLDPKYSAQPSVNTELTNSADQTVSASNVKGTVNVSLDVNSGAEGPSGVGKVAVAVYESGTNRMVSINMWDVDLSDPDYLLIRTITIPDGVRVGSIRLMVMGANLQPVMSAKGM